MRTTSLAFMAAKGGTGKSTLSLNLAVEFSLMVAPKPVVLVDGDQQIRTVELKLIDVGGSDPRLEDALSGRARWQDVVYACCLKNAETDEYIYPNLYILPAGGSFLPDIGLDWSERRRQLFWEHVDAFDALVRTLARKCEYVLIDTPARMTPEHVVLISAADAAIPVLNPDDDTYISTTKSIGEYRYMLGSFGVLGCVLNRVPAEAFDERRWVDRAEQRIGKVLGVVHADDLIQLAFSRNFPVRAVYPEARSVAEMRGIARRIADARIGRRKRKLRERIERAVEETRRMISHHE
jgi:MinD-like ATPase involved in chromosome partitioning or flagellar assembly